MSTRLNVRLVLALLVAGAFAALAQEPGFDARKIDQAEAQKRARHATTLSLQHEKLNVFLGEWDVEFWVNDFRGGGGFKSAGTASSSWLIEGRWLQTRIRGTFMNMPFESYHIKGFDNFRRKYVETAVDNLYNAMNSAAGNWTRDGKSLVMYGTMNEPATGEIGKAVKYAIRVKNADKHVVEIYDLVIGEGDESLVMKMIFSRKK